jgi:Zn-dependent peptidase ImmA (M78 family)
LDPRSLLDDQEQPRFVWKDEARFKHLAGESEIEQAAITSFGKAIGSVLIAASPGPIAITGATANKLRQAILNDRKPYVRLVDLLSLCWSTGIPVVHLRVFPWPQKRMAAMTVQVKDRCAILLGKDSMYPAQIAFYLAHELGHISLSHLANDRVIVDLEPDAPKLEESDAEEAAADRFALELLTGDPKPIVLPSGTRYSARELARVALASAEELKVEPGTLALCFGYSTNDWATANASLQRIYSSPKHVWNEINNLAHTQLALERVPDDAVDYLNAVLGSEPS